MGPIRINPVHRDWNGVISRYICLTGNICPEHFSSKNKFFKVLQHRILDPNCNSELVSTFWDRGLEKIMLIPVVKPSRSSLCEVKWLSAWEQITKLNFPSKLSQVINSAFYVSDSRSMWLSLIQNGEQALEKPQAGYDAGHGFCCNPP